MKWIKELEGREVREGVGHVPMEAVKGSRTTRHEAGGFSLSSCCLARRSRATRGLGKDPR